jgi:hypothetical protein
VSGALRGRGWLVAIVVLAAAIIFGSFQGAEEGREPARSSFDEGASGFAAWAELLRKNGVEVAELSRPPSSGGLDADTTVVALDVGKPTGGDVEAFAEFVDEGGYLIAGGKTDDDAITEMTGLAPVTGGDGLLPQRPVLPVAQTEGVTEVDPAGGEVYSDPGGALPVLGSTAGDLLLLAAPAAGGQVALLASSDALTNDRITEADNAQLAIDLGRANDRPVILLRSLAISEGREQGVSALPSAWTAGFAGLLLAALLLIASRVRRLGPPDGDPAPAAEPRSGYVDAMARNLSRRGDLAAAAEPVRRAALDGIARRTGAPPGANDADMLAAHAEQAGVPRDEAEALAGPLEEPEAAIKATRALARMRR